MINPFKGLVSLTQSRKAWFCGIIFGVTAWLCHGGHISDIGFGAVCTAVVSIWTYAHLKSDPLLPDRGQR